MQSIQAHQLLELGRAHQDAQRHEQALACFDQSLNLDPTTVQAHWYRGVALQSLARWQESVMSLSRALELDPSCVPAWKGLGLSMMRMGHLDQSAQCFEQATKLAPGDAEAHNNLGALLKDLGRLEDAIASYQRALQAQPHFPEAWNNLGLALRAQGDFVQAHEALRRAVDLDPLTASSWSNLGVTLTMSGRHEEALACQDRALALEPGEPNFRWNRSLDLLALGKFKEGWHAFEARWEQTNTSLSRRFPRERQWDGRNDIRGKTLLVHHEQGLGDSLQFCRFIPVLCEQGARVVVQVPKPLVRLLGSLQGVAQVIDRDDPVPGHDWHVPMMSLPACLGTDLGSIPSRVPYLRADRDDAATWAHRLGRHDRPRVGLVWSGGVRTDLPKLHATNTRRNMAFAQMAALHLPGVDFFSLQKGDDAVAELHRDRPRHWPFPNLMDFTEELRDFADTAALVDNLDLVVSVDTATVHLAGALAKPVWILNRYDMCWRWRLDTQGSPWYPSARLFTQQTPLDWSPVITQVAQDLRHWAEDWQAH